MSSTLNHTMGAAKNVMDSAREGSEHAVSSARSTFLEKVKTMGGVVAMLRALDLDDGLRWVGLARRRPLRSFAIFSAGVALGAGVGVLFAPMSGADMRRAILKRLEAQGRKAKDRLEQAEAEVKKVGEKAEDLALRLAGNAEDAAKKAERKVEVAASSGPSVS